jgi:hypothetical protein
MDLKTLGAFEMIHKKESFQMHHKVPLGLPILGERQTGISAPATAHHSATTHCGETKEH